jgi:2-C-methyl-D-erythritol 4-phosphate cytidylyltransferase
MKSDIPKQFIPLSGLPVLMHSIRAFIHFDPSILIVVALPSEFRKMWEELCNRYDFRIGHTISNGGEKRFHSVKNALLLIPDESLVAIHDGVRPLVSAETIRNAFHDAGKYGNAVPVIPVHDSVRKAEGDSNSVVPRDSLRLIQTPQVFRAELIKNAYRSADRDDYTDDATLLEMTGERIHLFEGNRENIKITYPVDIEVAEALLKLQQSEK